MKTPMPVLVFVLILLSVFTAAGSAHAHKIRIFAWPEGDVIHGETAFSGNKKPKNVEISVIDAKSGKLLLQTRTDSKGDFTFTPPGQAVAERLDLLLVVNTVEGHRGEWPLPADEYLSPNPQDSTPNVRPQPTAAVLSPAQSTTTAAPLSPVNEDMLRRIIDEELDRKLAPIRQILAEQSDTGPSPRDILAGIGFILGLAGLAAWLQSKKQQNKKKE